MKRLKVFTLITVIFFCLILAGQIFAGQLRAINSDRQIPITSYRSTAVAPNAVSNRLARMETEIRAMSKQISTLKAEVGKLKKHTHTYKKENLGWVSAKTVVATKKGLLHVKYPGASAGPITVTTSKPVY